jgi:WD40 repeat protein
LTAILLSLEAFRNPDDSGPERYEVAAEKSLTDALYRYPLQYILPHEQQPYAQAAYAYDGSRLVTLDDKGGVATWTLDANGRPVKKDQRPDLGAVKTVLANPTKPVLFIRRNDLSYFAWNYLTNEKVKGTEGRCDDDLGNYSDFKFDRSGERLLIWCKRVDVIELATGRSVTKPGPFGSVAMSGDGKRFATLREKTPVVEVWTTATGALVKSWSAPDSGLVLMNYNGETVYTRYGYYRVGGWKSATGTVQFPELASQTRSTEIIPQMSGDLLATGGDDGVKVWNGATGQIIQHLPDTGIQNFLPNGLLAVQDGQNVTLWDYIVESRLGHYEAKRRAVLHTDKLQSLAASSVDGKRVVTIGADGDIYIWRTDPAMLLRANDDGGDCLHAINMSADGKTVAAVIGCATDPGGDAVALFDADTLRARKRIDFKTYDSVSSVRLSRDGRLMLVGALPKVAGNDKTKDKDADKGAGGPLSYEVTETASGKRVFPAAGALPNIIASDLSADGEWVASASNSDVDIWRVADGSKSRCHVGGDDSKIIALAFDQGSSRLAVASSSGVVRLLEPTTCAANDIMTFGANVGQIELAYRDGLVRARAEWKDSNDPDISSRLQIANDREKKVVVDRSSTAGVDIPYDVVNAGDRILLAHAEPDGDIQNVARFVDLPAQQDIGEFMIDTASCCNPSFLHFYPDRHRLLTGWSERGASRLRAWQVLPTIDEMRDFAKSAVPECLSPERRTQFGLESEPPRWCIELAKQPYDTAEWKQWLVDKLAGKSPPIPDSGSP